MKRKVLKPNVVRGGIAIPLGANYYYMSGRKHKDGGIDVGKNPRTGLEVEDGEVMHITKNEAKVFSSVPFLNGKSPAQKVMSGENPNNVFKQQEKFKDINNINDDGTKKEFERKKAFLGTDIYDDRYGFSFTKAPKKGTKPKITVRYKKSKNSKSIPQKTFYDENGREIITFDDAINKYNKQDHINLINTVIYDRNVHGDLYPGYNKDAFGKPYSNVYYDQYINSVPNKQTNNKFANNINTKTNNKKINNTKTNNTKTNNNINKVNNRPTKTNTKTNVNNTKTNNKTKSTNSFANAFSSARKAGKDIFEWNGKKYTTKLAGETTKSTNKINNTTNNKTNTITPNSNLPFGNDIIQNSINPKQLEKENKDIRKNPFIVKMRAGGVYSVTSNGKTRLRMLPSTGERTKAVSGTKKKFTEKDKLADIERTNKYINSINLNSPKSYKDIAKQVYGNKYEPYKTDPKNIKLDVGIPAFLNDGRIDYKAMEYAKQNGYRLLYNKSNNSNKTNNDKQNNINDIVSDSLGVTSNIIGSAISHTVNKKMLNKLKYNKAPINLKATKLKTNININPQLDKMRENLASYERDIDNNTASSRVALARKQKARIANMLQTNELYGEKENNETELINKDRINQQSVMNKNIEGYNNWRANKVAFENALAEKKSENDVGLINSINSAVQDIIGRRELRGNERQNRLALMAANPNVSPRLLRAFGIKGITDKDIENFDKAHRRKINN